MKFHVVYHNGTEAEHVTDDATVEAFQNSHFGSTWEYAEVNGASVTIVDELFIDEGALPTD